MTSTNATASAATASDGQPERGPDGAFLVPVDLSAIQEMCRAEMADLGSRPPIVSINGDVLLAVVDYAMNLRSSMLREAFPGSNAYRIASRDPVVVGPRAHVAWGSRVDLVRPSLPRPSEDELAGLLMIRTGNVSPAGPTSVRQAQAADGWIDRLFVAMEDLPDDPRAAQSSVEFEPDSGVDLDAAKVRALALDAVPLAAPPELKNEAAYLDLMRRILDRGERRTNRTGTDTLSIFGAQMRFDLRDGFPLLTTKKVQFPSIVRELLWFLRGSTNVNDDLTQHTKIWDAWADPDGDLGPIYGFQWRHWGADPHQREKRLSAMRSGSMSIPSHSSGIDQIARAIRDIKTNPDSRRIIVSAWNVADVPKMRLPPCHLLFQFNVVDGHLDCQLYQRSADMALGVPFNIASYALLLSMIAGECRLTPRHFVHSLGDAHVYVNHVDGVREQVERAPLPLPRLILPDKTVDQMTFEDVLIEDYRHHPAIKYEVSV